MGLLDEAIREHLELRRRRGADPQEIAREEQEALEPIDFRVIPAWAQGPAALDPQAPEVFEPQPLGAAPFDGSADGAAGEEVFTDGSLSAAGAPDPLEQQTVEVDMDALIAREEALVAQGEAPLGPITARRITSSPAGPQPDEDFEWEVPQRQAPDGDPHEPAQQGSLALE